MAGGEGVDPIGVGLAQGAHFRRQLARVPGVDEVVINPVNGRILVDNISITATPEPSTIVMLGTGLMTLAGVGVVRRRRRTGKEVSALA